jgi:thiol-disulfide isomerase/thioredoxin
VTRAVAPALLFALVAAASPIASSKSATTPPATPADSKAQPSAQPSTVPAPVVSSVIDIDGIKKSMRGSRGRVLLVHFWATWCLPCLEELPVISQFARDMKPRGLDVLSLSLDDPQTAQARVSKLLSEQAPNLTPVIAKFSDADQFIGTFDSRWEGTIPALFAYDATGQRRGSHVGEASRGDLDQLVGRLLKPGAGAGPGKKK